MTDFLKTLQPLVLSTALVATVLLAQAVPSAAADLKFDNLENEGPSSSLTRDEIESAEPLDEQVTPEAIEEMKKRYLEYYPAETLPQERYDALEEKGVPEPVVHPERNNPYFSVGKLVFKKTDGKTHRCTAQFVSDNVLLTAAHCVYDTEAKAWNTDFTFLRAFDDGTYQQKIGWVCVSIYDAYFTPAKNYAFDYAFILTDVADGEAALTMVNGRPATLPLTAVGYPKNFGGGKVMYRVDGDWGAVNRGIVTMSGNPMRSGNSGGAWFSEFKVDGGRDNNLIYSLNSHHIVGKDTEENGPLFTADTGALFRHVAGGCM